MSYVLFARIQLHSLHNVSGKDKQSITESERVSAEIINISFGLGKNEEQSHVLYSITKLQTFYLSLIRQQLNYQLKINQNVSNWNSVSVLSRYIYLACAATFHLYIQVE